MTRQQAFDAMKGGKKITHHYFASNEFYEMKNGKIIAEDGVNHTYTFWENDFLGWREDGWIIFEPTNLTT